MISDKLVFFVFLQPLVTLKGVHNIFVTGLAFLPDSQLVNNQLRNEFAVLSISADNTCKVTTLKRRGRVSIVAYMTRLLDRAIVSFIRNYR